MMSTNIQLLQQPDLSEDAAGLFIREELGIKARSVLVCHEILGPHVWQVWPDAVQTGRLLRGDVAFPLA